MLKESLMVDKAYELIEDVRKVIVEVDGEYYHLPTPYRESNDLTTFKKIPKNVIEAKGKREIPNYRYATLGVEKRTGHDVKIGRAISEKEFEDLKKSLKLTEDDISEPFEEVKGSVYGERSEKRFMSIQIKVDDLKTLEVEKALRKKGIEASGITSGRINIRVPEWTLKEFRTYTKMSQSEFAFHFGLSVRNVQEWEQGKKEEPPYLLNLLERIWKLENK